MHPECELPNQYRSWSASASSTSGEKHTGSSAGTAIAMSKKASIGVLDASDGVCMMCEVLADVTWWRVAQDVVVGMFGRKD